MFNGGETGTSGVKSWFPLFFLRIRQGLKLFLIKWKGGIEYFVGFDLHKISFIAQKSITSKLLPLEISTIFSQTKSLTHHAGTLRHSIVVDFNAKTFNKIGEASGVFGLHELTFLKQEHFFVYFFDEKFEFIFITSLTLVKFDYSLFECNNQSLKHAVIFVLLLPCGKPTIDAH